MATRNLEEAHNAIIGLLETAWDATGIVGNIPKLKAPHAPPHMELSLNKVPEELMRVSKPIRDMYSLDVLREYVTVYQFLNQNEDEIVNIDTQSALEVVQGRPDYQEVVRIAGRHSFDDEIRRIFDRNTGKSLRKDLVGNLKAVLAEKIKEPTGK